MAIPTYDDIFLPLLEIAADGATRRIRDAYGPLATHFHLNEQEKTELNSTTRTPSRAESDGRTELMDVSMEHRLGVTTEATHELPKLDKDYFSPPA